MRRILLVPAVSLLALAACADDREAATLVAPPAVAADAALAFLDVSHARPAAGDTVTVTAVVHNGAAVSRVGAFTVDLAYDATGLAFVAEAPLASGMRVVNAAQPGRVIVAGASAEGFAEGRLFALTFRVQDPAALRGLALTVTELGGTDYRNHKERLDVDRRLYSTKAR